MAADRGLQHRHHLVGQALAVPHARVELDRLPRPLVLQVAVLLRSAPGVDVVHCRAAALTVELHRRQRRQPAPRRKHPHEARRFGYGYIDTGSRQRAKSGV
eukprot:scaffold5946_cov101-Phaeocystis_antarctica.AAC.1